MDNFLLDLRFAARSLRRSPGFTTFALLTLALGIGANTAIFSVVNGILLRPLAFPDADRLMTVWQDHRSRNGPQREWVSPPNFQDWRAESTSFTHLTALGGWTPTLSGNDTPERLNGMVATHDVFDVFGVGPVRGRGFLEEEDRPGGASVVVISHELWQRRFGGDFSTVGRTITLNATPYTIVGIMPADFRFVPLDGIAQAPDVWAPAQLDPERCGRGCVTLRVVGRLAEGTAIETAQIEMQGISARLAEAFPQNRGVGAFVLPLHQHVVGDLRPAVLVLLAAVGFVLIVACANVANLLLARGATRRTEIAVRSALGAGQPRLIRQLLTESLLLALISGVVGVLCAFWGIDLLLAAVPAGIQVPQLDRIGLDVTVLLFAIGVSLFTGIVFGSLPALQTSRPNLTVVLKEGARDSRPGVGGIRGALVVTEVAVAIVLLVGAGLLAKSFVGLLRVDPGFDPDNVLTVSVALPPAQYPEVDQVRDWYARTLENVRRLPAVEIASAGSVIPMAGGNADSDFGIEGRPDPQPGDPQRVAWYRQVAPDYFATLDIAIVEGRPIGGLDHAEAPLVVVINESLGRQYWPGESAVGRRITLGDRSVEIVGIAADIKNWGLGEEARPAIYLSHAQFPARGMSLVIRTAIDPLELAAAVRREISQTDPNLAPSGIATLRGIVAESVSQERLTTLLLGVFAMAALGLAAIGLYGALNYTVTQRTREIGIHMALGAPAEHVRGGVLRQGLMLTALGVGVGLLIAAGLSRLMAGLLFGVNATDPLVFATVPLALGVVSLVASYMPAYKATRVDPVVALRHE